jgi:mRNA interferase RelE/StbE
VAKLFEIQLARSATKELAGLPTHVAERVEAKIDQLARNPRPAGAKKLQGEPYWRLRVGDYRILYTIDDAALTIFVGYIRHRSKAYELI